jgi:hypothetical protein
MNQISKRIRSELQADADWLDGLGKAALSCPDILTMKQPGRQLIDKTRVNNPTTSADRGEKENPYA